MRRTTAAAVAVAGAALALVAGGAGTATAATSDGGTGTSTQTREAEPPTARLAFTMTGPGAAFAVPGALPAGATAPEPRGADCEGGPTDPCGIIYNRTGHTLQLARDSSSHWSCLNPKNFRNLPSGRNSNSYGSPKWPDVDCFRDRNHWVFTNGRPYPPGEWIRTWTAKWIY